MSSSGYFDDLVARALGKAPLLTPRRPSRFEPASVEGVSAFEPEDQAEGVPGMSGLRQQPDQSAPVENLSRRTADPAQPSPSIKEPGWRPRAEADSRQPDAADRPAKRPEPAQEESLPVRDQAIADDGPLHVVKREVREAHVRQIREERILTTAREGEPSNPLRPQEREAASRTTVSPAGNDRDSNGRAAKLDEIDLRVKALEGRGEDGQPGTPARPVTPPREVIRETRPATVPGRVLVPRITNAPQRSSQLPSIVKPAPVPREPEPTVQVSIGRIEVRASAAAGPPRARGSARPRLSLDDYLRQREGG
jgi:hypothetical protein